MCYTSKLISPIKNIREKKSLNNKYFIRMDSTMLQVIDEYSSMNYITALITLIVLFYYLFTYNFAYKLILNNNTLFYSVSNYNTIHFLMT